jgi:hypothetical protein
MFGKNKRRINNMKLCSTGHDQVCYEAPICPACSILAELSDIREENKDLNAEMDAMQKIMDAEDYEADR